MKYEYGKEMQYLFLRSADISADPFQRLFQAKRGWTTAYVIGRHRFGWMQCGPVDSK